MLPNVVSIPALLVNRVPLWRGSDSTICFPSRGAWATKGVWMYVGMCIWYMHLAPGSLWHILYIHYKYIYYIYIIQLYYTSIYYTYINILYIYKYIIHIYIYTPKKYGFLQPAMHGPQMSLLQKGWAHLGKGKNFTSKKCEFGHQRETKN